MAYCNPSTLTAQGSAFQGLSPAQIRIAQIALLRRWLLALDPFADVTPSGIMSRARVFTGMSPGQVRWLTLQLLCNISA